METSCHEHDQEDTLIDSRSRIEAKADMQSKQETSSRPSAEAVAVEVGESTERRPVRLRLGATAAVEVGSITGQHKRNRFILSQRSDKRTHTMENDSAAF